MSIRALAVAVLAAALSMSTTAQPDMTFVHVSDTSLTSGRWNGFPFAYGEGAHRYQFLIPAPHLPRSPLRITELAFVPERTGVFAARTFQIRMAHTSLTRLGEAFDANLGGAARVVFEGPVRWPTSAGQWSPIRLQKGFEYDGKSNLVVEIRYRSAGRGASILADDDVQRVYNYWAPDPYSAREGRSDRGRNAGPKVRLTVAPRRAIRS
jgi:hypothetical protein